MFGSEALRLLRENWPNPTMLAQELYSIFNDAIPTTSGPITVTNNNPAGPGMTINNAGGSTTPLTFTGSAPDDTNFTIGPDGGLIIQTPSFQTQSPGQPPAPPGGGGGGTPGQVVSGGPGASYQVKLFPAGLAGATKTVTVTQLSIDPGETIPEGTWALVTQAGANYYMQCPVWLAPTP